MEGFHVFIGAPSWVLRDELLKQGVLLVDEPDGQVTVRAEPFGDLVVQGCVRPRTVTPQFSQAEQEGQVLLEERLVGERLAQPVLGHRARQELPDDRIEGPRIFRTVDLRSIYATRRRLTYSSSTS